MIIQRQNYRPNQPPHFAKRGGNLTLKSELYDQRQKIKLPLVFLHFSRLGDSPLALMPAPAKGKATLVLKTTGYPNHDNDLVTLKKPVTVY